MEIKLKDAYDLVTRDVSTDTLFYLSLWLSLYCRDSLQYCFRTVRERASSIDRTAHGLLS